MVSLGMDPASVTVLRNGVDLKLFRPGDRSAVRQQLGWQGNVLLSVGLLIERKGHHLAIDMMRQLPEKFSLMIAGEGPMRGQLERQIAEAGLVGRVHLLGSKSQTELVDLYGAADALVLASSREGMANVLLESLACGTPLLATRAWGTPEVVRDPVAGVMADERSAQALAAACLRLFAAYPDRAATRQYAETFGWDTTTNGQLELFDRVLGNRA
jgi:glycosyltransferase involved in cell wall biosynthesis